MSVRGKNRKNVEEEKRDRVMLQMSVMGFVFLIFGVVFILLGTISVFAIPIGGVVMVDVGSVSIGVASILASLTIFVISVYYNR